MTHVQEFLRAHGLDELRERYSIMTKRHGLHDNLVLLKYNQIESPMGEPVVQECRGIILDQADDWRIVSFPYRKFFNHGEGHAAPIEWSTARVLEKLDGSLMTLYWYANDWHVSTSGTPDADSGVWGEGMTFGSLFWETWDRMGWMRPESEGVESGYSYMFELCCPENRVVVPHTERRLLLHGARNLVTLAEENHREVAHRYGWDYARSWPLMTIDQCVSAADALDPMQTEGFVVVDGRFNRLKIKSPKYVAIHHAKDGLSRKRFVDLARNGEESEFLAYFPQLRAEFDAIASEVAAWSERIEADFARHRGIETQKDYAMAVKDTPYSAALFLLRAGKIATARDWFKKATLPAVLRLLGVPDEDEPKQEAA